MLANLTSPALFWLDAHYNTPLPEGVADYEVETELEQVLSHAKRTGLRHAIAIDDMNQITNVYNKWPSMRRALCAFNASSWSVTHTHDVVVIQKQ